ncbi:hypothetical protein SLE2022_307960 [Rubroshorea leprosula]
MRAWMKKISVRQDALLATQRSFFANPEEEMVPATIKEQEKSIDAVDVQPQIHGMEKQRTPSMVSTVAKVEIIIKPVKMAQYQSPISTHEPELGVLHCNGSVAGWTGCKGKLCSAPDACHLFGEIPQRGFGSPEFIYK